MNDYFTKIEQLIPRFDVKTNKKLKTDVFFRLCKKVQNDDDSEIESIIMKTYIYLVELSNDEATKPKNYRKSFNILKNQVRKNLGYTPKGLIQEEYTGIGIALGVALGSAFITLNPAFIGIGIPIGLVIGAGIGQKKEKEQEEAGKTY